MNDLISRQAAIDELGYCQTYLFDSRDKDKKISLEDAEYAIEQLPSAHPEPQWIPVSERLPDESGWYICTCHDGVSERVTFLKWQKRLKQWEKTGTRSYWKVIAWMPLPEPYKPNNE